MTKQSPTTARPKARSKPRRAVPARSLGGPLLVAVNEADAADGALQVADLLARRDRANAHLLGLAPPLAFPLALVLPVDHQTIEDARAQQLLAHVRRLLSKTLGVAVYWSTEAAIGHPATVVARTRKERDSALVILALPDANAPHRTAREDAALQIIRAVDVSVLAVPPGTGYLPRRALVAMDFSDASRRAALVALTVLGSNATITLAHVQPDLDFAADGRPGWEAIYERGLAGLFDELATELRAAGDVTVDTTVRRGDPATSLLDLARDGKYDLIAAGTQGITPLDRYLVGSVSTALLRGSRTSVLIVSDER